MSKYVKHPQRNCENVKKYTQNPVPALYFRTLLIMAKKSRPNTISLGDTPDFTEPEIPAENRLAPEQKPGDKWYLDIRLHKSLGVLCTLFSILLCLASISFFFSWKADQNIVRDISWNQLSTIQPNMAQNWVGVVGAWLAFVFVYKGFGLGAIIISLDFFVIGIFLLTRIRLYAIRRTLAYSFFSLLWISVSCGFLASEIYPVLGGSFGYFSGQWLMGAVGLIGTILLLMAYALIYLIAVFNISFIFPKKAVSEVPLPETPASITDKNRIEMLQPEMTSQPVLDEIPEPETIDMVLTHEAVEPEEAAEKEEEAEEESDEEEIDEEEIPIDRNAEAVTTESGLVLELNETPKEEEEEIELKRSGLDDPYDPTLDFSKYTYPTIDLLQDYGDARTKVDQKELLEKTKMIEDTLRNYNIGIKKISATVGPTVTLYEIIPQDGVRIAKIKNLEDDIALSLSALGIRIIAPIPGRGTIGIEVPNSNPAMVPMRTVIGSSRFQNADMELPIAFGKTISDEVFVADLAKMPHLLMAGATGQGKSVGINTILVSLLYKKHPSQIKFVLVDPKKVELSIYKTIERHFLAKVPGDADAIITDTKLVINTLNSLCKEMDDRYDLLKDAQVRNIREYNAKFISRRLPPTDKFKHRFLPYIVVVIDELADLMMTAGKEVEHPIARLAQLARAIGIHLILATQRPSVNIITGTIKANFPARVAFRVSQKIDSRTILDANGADQLIGKGDMLFSNGNDLVRLQCAFVDTPEVDKIASYIGNQTGKEPYELPLVLSESDGIDLEGGGFDHSNRDELFEEAARIIVIHQQGSTSLLQRKLNLGYNRAGRLIDQLEKAGVVGPFKGSKAREVLIHTEVELEERLRGL